MCPVQNDTVRMPPRRAKMTQKDAKTTQKMQIN